jgi:hypothetical protein
MPLAVVPPPRSHELMQHPSDHQNGLIHSPGLEQRTFFRAGGDGDGDA